LPSLERAEPFLQFRVDRVLAAADLATIEGRARAAEAAARMVAEHPSELVRDQYAIQLAGSLDLDADGVRSQVTRAAMEPRREPQHRRTSTSEHGAEHEQPPEHVKPLRVDRRELDVLRWAVHEPALVADWLDESLFLDPVARGAYNLLVSSENMHQAIDAAEGSVRHLLERLAVEDPQADDEPTTVRGRLVVNTVEPVAKRMLARMLREGDDRASTVKMQLDTVAHCREVGDWPSAQEAAIQLVGWVVTEARRSAPNVQGVTGENTVQGVTGENTRVEQEA
jgi:DNA primase